MTALISPKAAEGRLSGRIGPTHLERLAIVYVRQSTPQQIERNQESTRLQYALVERAVQRRRIFHLHSADSACGNRLREHQKSWGGRRSGSLSYGCF
jgi:hypothetical protein